MARDHNRSGNVLGIGNPVPEERNHAPNSSDSEEAKRHRRMNEGADELTPSPAAPHRGSGATGIDMGSGGEGTDLE